jgi:hypothetical protein
MLRAAFALSAALAALSWSPRLSACACRGVGSPSAALTLSGESWGLALTSTSELAHGVWDVDGGYHALSSGELYSRETLGLALALRVLPRWEIGLGTELVSARVSTPTLSDENSGLGDVRFRGRWEAVDEPMPHESSLPWPAVALLATLSSGTAEGSRDRAASLGLGASEVAIALQLVRSLGAWQLEALFEVGQRAPDTSLDIERQLGPRALFELGLSYPILPVLRLGGTTALGLEGDTVYDGEVAAGSGQRLWTVGLFAVQELKSLNAQTSLGIEHAPALEGASVNAIGNTGLRLSFSLSR